jgi:hypothetical protein
MKRNGDIVKLKHRRVEDPRNFGGRPRTRGKCLKFLGKRCEKRKLTSLASSRSALL